MEEVEGKCNKLKELYEENKMNEEEKMSYENWCYNMKEIFR